MVQRSTSSFGLIGTDWQQRIDWDDVRKYRLGRARQAMKDNGLGAILAMYDENVRYITSTITPGWCRLKPGLRYALLCDGAEPVLFEQGDIGTQINEIQDVGHPRIPAAGRGRGGASGGKRRAEAGCVRHISFAGGQSGAGSPARNIPARPPSADILNFDGFCAAPCSMRASRVGGDSRKAAVEPNAKFYT